jgi:hypothetical protein
VCARCRPRPGICLGAALKWLSQWNCYEAAGGSTGEVDQAVEMDPRAVIRMTPSEAQAAAGGQARFTFAVIERRGVAYSVESAVSSWSRLLLPAGHVGSGELVVDVPDDAGPGRYLLRLIATASGQEVAAANVMLRIATEPPAGGKPCLKVLPRPKFDLQPDGTVVVTLQVVNCGNVDATLVLRARHEDGWSFSVDEPELVVGVQQGPVTVKVTLRPPEGHGVDQGDEITVEVNVGTGWKPVRGRVPRRLWPWVAAAAAVVAGAAGATAAVLASQDESTDNVAVAEDGPADDTVPEETTEATTGPEPEPVQILSFSVDKANACTITIMWTATGDREGQLELYRDGEPIAEDLPVGEGSHNDELSTDTGSYTFTYELKAFDTAGTQTHNASEDIDGECPDID